MERVLHQAHDFPRSRRGPRSSAFELAVIVPTYREAGNVATLLGALDAALVDLRAEIIFVDDWSPDGTADAIARLTQGRGDVRVVRRYGRRGLSSAVIEGMMATMAPVVAVIDGDGQHDETLLPCLFRSVATGRADVAIGSRYCAAGSIGDWDARRAAASRTATSLSRLILPCAVADPMSGFFAIRTAHARRLAPELSAIGFKILLDLMTTSAEPLRFAELPYTFRVRTEGESKLDHVVAMEYLIALYDRMFGHLVPVRFAMFSGIGVMGVGVHMSVLGLAMLAGADFIAAQLLGALAAMTFNFVLNNTLTYRDRRLKGWRQLLDGWVSFCAVCSVGLVANVGIAAFVHDARSGGIAASALIGVLVGAVWNYALSSRFVWGRY